MNCQRCNLPAVASITGKVDDRFILDNPRTGEVYQGEVPDDIGLGGGDYIRFRYCMLCGQIQGVFPIVEIV